MGRDGKMRLRQLDHGTYAFARLRSNCPGCDLGALILVFCLLHLIKDIERCSLCESPNNTGFIDLPVPPAPPVPFTRSLAVAQILAVLENESGCITKIGSKR